MLSRCGKFGFGSKPCYFVNITVRVIICIASCTLTISDSVVLLELIFMFFGHVNNGNLSHCNEYFDTDFSFCVNQNIGVHPPMNHIIIINLVY